MCLSKIRKLKKLSNEIYKFSFLNREVKIEYARIAANNLSVEENI